jgi:hypothetical protein
VNPVGNGGLTTYDNMRGRCWDCHQKKTEADRRAGLLGGNGKGNGKRKREGKGRRRTTAVMVRNAQHGYVMQS